jgi:hypothetical protein
MELVGCESRVAVAVGRRQFGNPGKETSAVGCRYERTAEGGAGREDQVCI